MMMMMKDDFSNSMKERQGRATACQQLYKLASTKMMCELTPELSSSFHPNGAALTMRRLFENEVRTLSTVCRCRSQDWSKLRFVLPTEKQGVDQSSLLLRQVSDTFMEGTVVLIWTGVKETPQTCTTASKSSTSTSTSTGAKATLLERLPVGIHSNAVLSSSMVHLNARVQRNTCVSNTYVGSQAVVVNNGSISFTPDTNLGLLNLTVGPESGGGRALTVRPEERLPEVVEQMAQCQKANHTLAATPTMNIFEYDTIVRDTPTVDTVYLHPQAALEGANAVARAVLCSTAHVGGASTAQDVVLQWNSSITDGSTVRESILMEEAHAGPHSILVSSVLGPDVHVSCGEIHASVLGPNTNAHHQSLLIGVLWPAGRGNVGYGANVGSNHTGRLPDQECAAGEGTFWGLSTVIKFPMDLSAAPYSIVAAGTSMPPQRIALPFSLMVSGKDNINDIIPGWLLRSSPYTLSRSEKKYATRRKAQRHADYTGWKIIRAETVAMCWQARQVLQQADTSKQVFVTERELPGIGACRLAERGRVSGVEAYTDCIQRFALTGLLQQAQDNAASKINKEEILAATIMPELVAQGVTWNSFPWQTAPDTDWNLQKFLLQNEFGSTLLQQEDDDDDWMAACFQKLIALEKDYAQRVFKSKSRDDQRGAQTVPGYAEAHVAAEDDPVIQDARAHVAAVEEAVRSVLGQSKL